MTELRVPAKIENLEKVVAFFDENIGKEGCDRMDVAILHVVLEEVFVNIASYAYVPDEGDAFIRMAFHRNPLELELEFRDCGKPFNPLNWKAPDITRNVMERKIGGLGLFLVKKIMDTIQYTYTGGMNVLTMKKTLRLPGC
ncbi:ATP-binding protein [Ethanoligenens harbinense]|uniref:ATP-binding protein n=1 Tax=Ethanoligenens harbinense TaxID=253239 RepID=UPI000EA302C4|nr:ATP-binding protein [Ethanoligenens harbinense]AYF41795.1 ATP-binding protein [Ethanoligenens harbinense]